MSTSSALATKALRVEDIYNADDEEQRLRFLLEHAYLRALRDIHLIVTEAFDLDPNEFRLPDDAAREWAAKQAAGRVTMISETTRTALRELLADAIDEGIPTSEVMERIESLYLNTWKHRPETIARTEIGTAQRNAAIDRYLATGLVDRVKIHDGDGHGPCAERNGKVVPIEDAPDLLHPNCVLVLSPVLREGVI